MTANLSSTAQYWLLITWPLLLITCLFNIFSVRSARSAERRADDRARRLEKDIIELKQRVSMQSVREDARVAEERAKRVRLENLWQEEQNKARRRQSEIVARNRLAAQEDQLTFVFEAPENLHPGILLDRIVGAIELLRLINRARPDFETNDVTVTVRRFSYGSPLEILFILQGVQAAVGGVAGLAVGVNAAIQKIRRSNIDTRVKESEANLEITRNQAEAALLSVIGSSINQIKDVNESLQLASETLTSLRGVAFSGPSLNAERQNEDLDVPESNVRKLRRGLNELGFS